MCGFTHMAREAEAEIKFLICSFGICEAVRSQISTD